MTKRAAARPTTRDHLKVAYPEIRERFLSTSEEGDYAEWLVRVGRFVHHCWLEEESDRGDSPLDEAASAHLWDECTEGLLVSMGVEAVTRLENYRRKRLAIDMAAAAAPYAGSWPAKVGVWVGKTMLEGFVGGVGLVLLGLIVTWMAPTVVRDMRNAADALLPAATAPPHHGAAPKSP